VGGFHGLFDFLRNTVSGVWDSDSLWDDGIGGGCSGTWSGYED